MQTYNGYPYAGSKFKGIAIEFYSKNDDDKISKEQKEQFKNDLGIVKTVFDNLYKTKFIPWLTESMKENEKKDYIASLKLYNVTYFQNRNSNEFEFQYEAHQKGSTSTEPIAFCIAIKDSKVSNTHCYDI